MPTSIPRQRLESGYERAKAALLAERTSLGHWEGELSSSALSTATSVMALELVRRGAAERADVNFSTLIGGGLRWIALHQNPDGGWGDTTLSHSNIATTMLCHAAFHGAQAAAEYSATVQSSQSYIEREGGVAAVRARYGKDKTFSIPILTHCALAGLVDWREVAALPFELACVPARFYRWVRMPVVSYALPALIAIGQARHHFVKPRNPLVRAVRNASIGRSLKILERIQPASGGFLEAAPLTGFVTMSLAGIGLWHHPVALRGTEFLVRSVRADGSWPIDTNLATWTTTLAVNALGDDLPSESVPELLAWLLGQQYQEIHPYTNSPPGAWAWTDLTGGVPDADDTPGAILALLNLCRPARQPFQADQATCELGTEASQAGKPDVRNAIEKGLRWLLDLQNRDGGWPTFCRGWGLLPFDRSAPDLTAHALRALIAWQTPADVPSSALIPQSRQRRAERAGWLYLAHTQRSDGSWLPLWFGNQDVPHDENPTYGTARVLAAYRDAGLLNDPAARRGLEWLVTTQNTDGGWGGGPGINSSVEETALALEIVLSIELGQRLHRVSETESRRSESVPASRPRWEKALPGEVLAECAERGLDWLLCRVENGIFTEPSPIGFYFAKLWYFEKLYPLIFTVAALGQAVRITNVCQFDSANPPPANAPPVR